MKTCETCRFWCEEKYSKQNYGYMRGQCRRNPPVVFNSIVGSSLKFTNSATTAFPQTSHEHWCGEYRPKDTDKEGA